MVFSTTFSNISVTVSFIGGGNRSDRRKPQPALGPFVVFLSQGFLNCLAFKAMAMRVSDDGYSRIAS